MSFLYCICILQIVSEKDNKMLEGILKDLFLG